MSYLIEGTGTIISLPEAGIWFEEIELTPPQISVGQIDTVTLRRTAWRTRVPKKLKTLDKISIKVTWDVGVYNLALGITFFGVNQTMNVTFADGHGFSVYAWVDDFKPDPVKEGDRPTAMLEICVSNQNSVGTEVGLTWF